MTNFIKITKVKENKCHRAEITNHKIITRPVNSFHEIYLKYYFWIFLISGGTWPITIYTIHHSLLHWSTLVSFGYCNNLHQTDQNASAFKI